MAVKAIPHPKSVFQAFKSRSQWASAVVVKYNSGSSQLEFTMNSSSNFFFFTAKTEIPAASGRSRK